MPIRKVVIPECRYGHGALTKVDAAGKVHEWYLFSTGRPPSGITYCLGAYVCPECGYVELFDADPAATIEGKLP